MTKEKSQAPDNDWRIPEALWERIEILLPPSPPHPLNCHKPPTEPRKAMDAIFFVLRSGVQWKSLSARGFIPGSTAHGWFQRWLAAGVFHELWKMMLEEYDDSVGIDWSWLSLDGSMVKAPLGGEDTGPNPTDRGKKGTKRSLLGDANGIPLALAVAGANVHDMILAPETLDNIMAFRPIPTPENEQNLCMDKGYDYTKTNCQVRQRGFTPHIRHRGEERLAYQTPGKPARRWVIERSNSWMNRFRRVLIRWEKKVENYVAMIEFAFSIIIFNKMKKRNCLFG